MANLTRADCEAELLRRVGGLFAKIGLDATTKDGTNASLNGPIRRAVRAIGLGVSDPVNVTDADVAGVTGWLVEKLVDLAELRALEDVWGNWAEYRQVISMGSDEPQQLADRIEARVAVLEARVRRPYGPNAGRPASGCIAPGRRTPRDHAPSARDGYGFPDAFSASYGAAPPW